MTTLRNLGALAVLMALVCVAAWEAGCERAVGQPEEPECCGEDTIMFPQTDYREVDLLFVIDNSGSMAGEQALLRSGFQSLVAELQALPGGLPNVHIGVTSTDLGTGMFQITYCENVGGDAGRLITGTCPNPVGAPYIVDVEPVGCQVERDAGGACVSHQCTEEHCLHEPSTHLVFEADTGCPRCRNYDHEDLSEVFGCIAELGTMGCGFEQPLEAMYKALDPNNTTNAGFLREEAILGVVIVTDEDDCSGSNPQLYDNTQTDINSTLGPLTSYRCFEFGVTCDRNERLWTGVRTECVPREDAAALLHPLSRYVSRLQEIKDPRYLVTAAIAGPVTPSPSGVGLNVTVELDEDGDPLLQHSCTAGQDGAVPAIRVYNVIDALNNEADMAAWAYTSVCEWDYSAPLQGVGERIVQVLAYQCLPSPVAGCADPGVDFGVPQMAQHCAVNSQCLAQCEATDIYAQGLPQQERHAVVPCLEVAPDGSSLPGNTDRSLAYAQGHPEERDPALPVTACWHLRYEPMCAGSHGAEVVISRPVDPPPKTVAEVTCRAIQPYEKFCGNYADDDENCLIDDADPCCAQPGSCEP